MQQLQKQLQQSGHGDRIEKRNPGEIFRQYAICIMEKLGATLKKSSVSRNHYKSADEFITDLNNIQQGLIQADCAQLAKSRMKPGGLLTTNVVDAFPDPKMVKSLMKTLLLEFKYVDIWVDHLPERQQRMTYVISASNKPIQGDILHASRGFERSWFRINQPLQSTGTPLDELPVFSDDFVPVERMIAKLLLTTEGL